VSAGTEGDATGAGTADRTLSLAWVKSAFRAFSPHVRPDRAMLGALCMLSASTVVLNAVLIWMIGRAVTHIASGEFELLDRTLLAIGAIVLAHQFIRFVYSYFFQTVTLRFVDRVRGAVLAHVMRVSFPILSKFQKGDLMTRISGDIDSLLAIVVNIPMQVFSNAVVAVVYLSLLLWIDWRLTLVASLIAPVIFLTQKYIAPRTGVASRQFITERARLTAMEEQTLGNLRGISAFNAEAIVRERHQRQFDAARAWAFRLRRIRIKFNTLSVALLYLAGVIVVFAGVSGVQGGRISIGALVSFLMYARFMAGPVRSIARIPTQLARNRPAADRVMEVLDSAPAIVELPNAPVLAVPAGRIDFEHVKFSYPKRDTPVFSDVSLSIDAGETVALVGPSGSGKSTLAGLLLRFIDPQSGVIRIDGVDIRSVALASLRERVSIVWQTPYVFDGTIRANLLLAKPDADEAQLVRACRSSHAWEFIAMLGHGLDTQVGVDGIQLSVGQVQRLAVAQAFLRDAPILILDEASSALDSHSEQLLVDALADLRQNRTTLIIAHRHSTIRAARRVVYLNGDGSITTGTHADLMERHPVYRTSVAWQTAES
jgi:ABC-type multidrug transport system fused ATPase/permease subunit